MGFTSANKLSLLLFSDFASSMATLASKALLLSGVFLPFMSPALFLSSYNYWHCATDIESYSSLEYFFNSIFPLKVLQLALVFCLLAGLVCVTDATFTLGVGAFLSMYWVRKATTASKSFSYLSGCALTAATAVDNLSHLMPFNRYQTFDPGLRPWYPYSMIFARIIWYLTWQATYFSQFHALFSQSYFDICRAISASDNVTLK